MAEIVSVTENQYRNEVVQYNPEKILELCNLLSARFLKENKTIIDLNWSTKIGRFIYNKVIHLAHHNIAYLAMVTIKNYRLAHSKNPSEKDFIALVNNATTIYTSSEDIKPTDPIQTLYSLMVRLTYQQFPFQENIHNVMPRHLLIYLYAKVDTPTLNLNNEFHRHFGLYLREYFIIGISFYGASLEHPTLSRSFFENTRVESLKKYLSQDKIENFLNKASADFSHFRDMCMQEVENFPKGGKYRFNPLFDRPIIKRKDGNMCIPVPMLVPYVITKGLYYDFLDLFSSEGEKGNQFTEWFGHAFEWYGGLLLKNTFGKKHVFPEPVYGKEQKRGPDWTVIQGDSAIVFEFRSGRLNKRTKIYGDYSDIATLVKRNIIEPLKKLPNKIEDIKNNSTNIPSNKDMHFFPCIVTYEPLYSNEMFREIVRKELKSENIPEFSYELMSIEDFEWLLSWTHVENLVDFFKEKWANPEWVKMSVRQLIEVKIKEKKITVNNSLLDKVFNKFWLQTIPELPQNRE